MVCREMLASVCNEFSLGWMIDGLNVYNLTAQFL
jgi:hypothetical protein